MSKCYEGIGNFIVLSIPATCESTVKLPAYFTYMMVELTNDDIFLTIDHIPRILAKTKFLLG